MDEAKDKLEELLMGFVPEDRLENAAESFGYSFLPFTANFAFGQASDSEYGDMSLFEYVYAHDEYKPHFFRRNRANAKREQSRDYLKSCMEYEKILIALVHILLGCGPRSTDYTFLQFDRFSAHLRTSTANDDTERMQARNLHLKAGRKGTVYVEN